MGSTHAAKPVCGNGIQQGGENCDGTQFKNDGTCAALGMGNGLLGCYADCTFDTSACSPPMCGDDQLDAGEQCDTTQFSNGGTCAELGLGIGSLGCLPDCNYDTSACVPGVCGDGAVDSGEECDMSAFSNDGTCAALGLGSGNLGCNGDCTFDTSACSPTVGIDCITNKNTLDDVVVCYQSNVPPENDLSVLAYHSANEIGALQSLVDSMLNFQCYGLSIPSVLLGKVDVVLFTDSSNNKEYCIVFDIQDDNSDGIYDGKYGMYAVPSSRGAVSRWVYHDATHSASDLNTEVEAARAFRDTGSVWYSTCGLHRHSCDSYNQNEPSCSPSNACQSSSDSSDGAHNDRLMQFKAFVQVHSWDATNSKDGTWIQWHGMGSSTCSGVDAFLSHGYSNSGSIYDQVTSTAELMTASLDASTSYNVHTPRTDGCSQLATTNVQGRLINGISEGSVCGSAASSAQINGKFLHIEQKIAVRQDLDVWHQAIKDTFATDCAAGLSENANGLCA